MPRFISAQDIPMKKRKTHLSRYKSQLRDALMNPALSDEQRAILKERLANAGLVKPYAKLAALRQSKGAAFAEEQGLPSGDSSPIGVESDLPPISGDTLEELLALNKDELLTLAESEGIEVFKSWTKPEIAQALLDHRIAGTT